MEKFFHLKENGTTVSTEIMAGLEIPIADISSSQNLKE